MPCSWAGNIFTERPETIPPIDSITPKGKLEIVTKSILLALAGSSLIVSSINAALLSSFSESLELELEELEPELELVPEELLLLVLLCPSKGASWFGETP